ncbi:transcription factor MYB73-like [Malus domestica]|uniref:transcription factor MYB73-like n=1 Tax=Malus domestica TaxID=3750 RepID=UPI00397644C2
MHGLQKILTHRREGAHENPNVNILVLTRDEQRLWQTGRIGSGKRSVEPRQRREATAARSPPRCSRNWSVTIKSMPGRSGKSCWQQWYNQQSPEVKQRAFTHEEDEITDEAHANYGNKWATIGRLLNDHTDNEISQ